MNQPYYDGNSPATLVNSFPLNGALYNDQGHQNNQSLADGTFVGGAHFVDASPILVGPNVLSGAVTFNGTEGNVGDDALSFGQHPVFQVPGNLTLEAWIKPTAINSPWDGIVGNLFDTNMVGHGGYGLHLSNNNATDSMLRFAFVVNGVIQIIDSPTDAISLNEWSHVAATYDGTTARIFVNGEEVASQAVSGAIDFTQGNDLRIGVMDDDNEHHYFNGEIADVRIWDVARTGWEIEDGAEQPVSPDSPGLIFNAPLNGGIDGTPVTSVTDVVGGLVGAASGTLVYTETGPAIHGGLDPSAPLAVLEDTVLRGRIMAEDIDGDILTFTLDAQAANGMVTVNPDGSYEYIPYTDYSGTDSFTVTVSDGFGGTDTRTISLNVASVTDALIGTSGDDTLIGTDGDDFIDGLTGRNVLIGGGGGDTLTGGTRGEFGVDRNIASYADATGPITVTGDTVTGDASVGTDTLGNIDQINGSAHDDLFDMTGWDNGQFTVFGGSIIGENNTVRGGGGDDTIIGSTKTRVDYGDAAGGVTATLNAGTLGDGFGHLTSNNAGADGGANGAAALDLADGTGLDTFVSGVNEIAGSVFDDILTGNDNNNVLIGRGGNDTLDGGLGMDRADYRNANGAITVDFTLDATTGNGTVTADGDGGSDTLISIEQVRGSQFADSFTGDGGVNRFRGEGGADTFTGNGGADRFEYTRGDESTLSAFDTITDFTTGTDKIVFNGMAGIELQSSYYAFAADVASTVANIVADASVSDRVVFFTDFTDGYLYVKGAGSGIDYSGTLIHLAGVTTPPTGADLNGLTAFVPTPPVIAGLDGDALTYTQGGGALAIDTGTLASVTDDTADFFGGSLAVGVFAGAVPAEDQISLQTGNVTLSGVVPGSVVSVSGIAVGTLANPVQPGTQLIIDFNQINGRPTLADINEILRAVTYENINPSTAATGPRTIGFILDDGDAGVTNADVTVTVVSGAPSIITGTAVDDSLIGTAADETFVATTTAAAGDDTVATGGGTDTLEIGLQFELVGAEIVDGDGDSQFDDLRFFYEDSSFTQYTTTVIDHAAGAPIAFVHFDHDENGILDLFTVAGTFSEGASAVDLVMAGSAAAETLTTGSGNDIVVGNAGDDTITGGTGDDRLMGGAGADTLTGGAGADVFDYLAAAESGIAGTDTDTITDFNAAEDSFDLLDVISGPFDYNGDDGGLTGSGTASAYYDVTNQRVVIDSTGSGVADMHINTPGVGAATLTVANFYVDSGPAAGFITGTSGDDTLIGGTGDDVIDGLGGINVLVGGAGNDTLTTSDPLNDPFTHRNTADYSDATGAITVTAGVTDQVTGDASVGTDTLGVIDRIVGSAYNDTFDMAGWDNSQLSSFSNSAIGSFNVVQGGAGDDTITGNGATRVSYADATGGVTVTLTNSALGVTDGSATGAGVGTDSFDSGVAEIQGSAFADTLTGNDLNNVLRGGAGADILDGGGQLASTGGDRADYRFDTAGITVTYTAGGNAFDATVIDGSGATDTLISIEQVRGSQFNDTFTGNDANNRFRGEGGADIFNIGDDAGFGGVTNGGSDRIEYTLGTYESNQFDGIDTINGFGTGDRIVLGGMDGVELLTQEFTYQGTVQATVDAIDLDDTIEDRVVFFYDSSTTTGHLYVKGDGTGATGYHGTLIALAGVSTVPAATQIYDSAGPLSATNGGTDALVAMAASETLTGGDTADYFVFTPLADSTVGTENTITDFNADQTAPDHDVIVLEGLIADQDAFNFGSLGSSGDNIIGAQLNGSVIEVDLNDDGVYNIGDLGINVSIIAGALDQFDFAVITTGQDGIDDAFFGSATDNFFLTSTTSTFATDIASAAVTTGDTITLAGGGDGIDTLIIRDPLELLGAEWSGSDLAFFYEDMNGGYIHKTTVVGHTTNPLDYVEFEFDEDTAGLERFAVATGPDASAATENTMIVGNGGPQTMIGGSGDDILLGNNGADTLVGGDGDDLLVGGVGVDHYDGGNGIDTISFFDGTQSVVIDMGAGTIGNDGHGGSENPVNFINIENVEGSHNGDQITGDAFANFLMGNDGNDVLTGGGGADILEGGQGLDVFMYTSVADSGVGSVLRDVILDFDATIDQIDLLAIVNGDTFNYLAGNGAFTGAVGTVEARFNNETKILEIDTDSDQQADMEIELQNVDGAALDENDFASLA